MKKGDIKKSINGKEYVLVKKLGRGGQAEVWKVQDKSDKNFYAYKEYKKNTNDIKSNIEDLIEIGHFIDKNDKVLEEVVLPITVVNGSGDSFGYIMELVDLDDYTVMKKAWAGKYPSCEAICKIVQNFARVFETLHLSKGMCYKDVNEGNVFFNPDTGDIKIIDNDNIGYSNKFTIKGTHGYMAPEVVLGDKPDTRSDAFSFSVFVYRLLIGGYPFEGPYTEDYCRKHDVLPGDAAKIIFGKKPLFVFHPTDRGNSLEKSADPQYLYMAERWKKQIPNIIKEKFISTFATNLQKDRRAERTTDADWYDTFAEIEKNLKKCPHCGKKIFSDTDYCFECDAVLNGQDPDRIPDRIHDSSNSSGNQTSPKHKVTFEILSLEEHRRIINAYVGDIFKGDKISKHLPANNLFRILYNKDKKVVGIENLSSETWKIFLADNKTKVNCAPNGIYELRKGMKIVIIQRTVQLNVEDVI